jgi:hypothetical protein
VLLNTALFGAVFGGYLGRSAVCMPRKGCCRQLLFTNRRHDTLGSVPPFEMS